MRTLITFLLLTSAAHAETMLLAEITQSGFDEDGVCDNCSNFWVGLKFGTYPDAPHGGTIIDGVFTTEDVGRVIDSTADEVHFFRRALVSVPDPVDLLSVALDSVTQVDPDTFLWNPPNEFTDVTMHVPRLGYALTGYAVHQITTTIEQAEYGGGHAAARYTVRLYGEQIPEPASWVLVLCGLAIQWRKRPCRMKGF